MIKPTNNIFFAINSTDFKIESRDLILNLDTFVKENCGSDVQRFTFEIKNIIISKNHLHYNLILNRQTLT